MNQVRKALVCIVLLAITLATSLSAYALDFDAEEIYNSIFVISSGNSLGSGFAFGDNCIITNAHVIANPSNVTITTYKGENYPAFVAAIDDKIDIAVLGVNDVTLTPLIPADYTKMSIGDDVCAIGAPNSMAYTLTKGCLSAKERKVGSHSYIQTDAAINTGNSGGPLLNAAGQVIGVNSYKISDAEGIGLAIPISTVTNFLNNCSIGTDESGNVNSIIQEQQEKLSENDGENTRNEIQVENPINIVLIIGLAISIVLNIILIVLLAYQKRKNIDLAYNPKERTDFDIDIWE